MPVASLALALIGTTIASDMALACEAASPSFHDANCEGSPARTRAMISHGSLVVMGASMADKVERPTEPVAPVLEAELRDLADQPPVRVVGPRFLPAPEAAIDLRAPGRTRGP